MKVLSLDLIAYGPFEGVEFDLSAGSEGLHILFGPNEAGKSSTLRALDALLFGMEARTLDAFRHPYDQLRVGGRLRTAAGDELCLVRRKGNKNTLRGADDTTVVDDADLERALGGVTRDTFRLMYGIDHDALVRGGRDILDQRGDVGQALFGTALGSAGLHRVLADLEAEAKALFLPSGSKPAINRTLSDFREASRQVKEHTLKTSHWMEADRTLRDAEAALAAVKANLAAARKRRSALERVRAVLPFAARRRALVDARAQVGDPVDLPDDFAARWARALDSRRTARDTLGLRKPQLEHLGAEIGGIVVPQGILDQGETIEAFREGLGGYRNAERDLPACRIERDGALDRARRVLATVRPDLSLEDAEPLRAILVREATLRDRARQHSLIVQRAETAQSEARQATAEGNRCRAALAALPEFGDPTALRQAVDRAKRGGEIDAEIEQKARTVADRAADLARRLSALGLWSGTVESLAEAPLPQDATVDRFEKDLTDLDRLLERNRETLETAAEEATRFARELEAIAATGSVPTEADLLSLRQRREQGWALVRARWLEGVEAADEVSRYVRDGDLPGAYEAAVEAADEVSDRLRREARRVEQQAAALAGRDAALRRRGEFEAERTNLAAARSQAHAAWAAAWAPVRIQPLGPAEMRGWLARARELRDRFEGLVQTRGDLATLRETRRVLCADLGAALAARGETPPGEDDRLSPLLAHAEARAEACDAVTRDREGREKDLATAVGRAGKAAADSQSARDDLGAWRTGWTPLVADLGLPADAEPEEALGVLGQVREMFVHLDEAAGFEARMASMVRELEGFKEQLRAFCARAAPDLVDRPPAEGVAELNARLKAGQEACTRRVELQRRLDDLAAEVAEAEEAQAGVEVELADLTATAGCAEEHEVADRIERHRQQQQLQAALDEVEGQILGLGNGLPLESLLDATRTVDADVLAADLAQLDTEIGSFEDQHAECLEARTRARAELERMDGSGAAAAAALEAQEYLALLGDQVERYTRARLAHRVLRDEIQRYREENEGPLLKRAGEIFGRLSLGSFSSLKVDYRDDTAVLVGERPDKGRTPVEGMSSGTRDQLYLALRLAAVERALERGEPLPFIVDDILVNFDDHRSKATLEVLAELARQTQVILFSHHSGIVELARGMRGAADVFVHQGWNGGTGLRAGAAVASS